MCRVDFKKILSCEETNATIKTLSREFPFVNEMTIGRSLCGRRILALRIGNARENMLFCASVHGNESITTPLSLRFCFDFCVAAAENKAFCGIPVRDALKSRSLTVVPMVNPDGCEIVRCGAAAAGEYKSLVEALCGGNTNLWKANARGVDINHNFDADWCSLRKTEESRGIFGPAPGMFGGAYPGSEPETVALTCLCGTLRPCHVVALHTQGEVIYYGYGTPSEKETRMAEILAMTSGYALDTPNELSGSGGFKDWFCKKYKKPGFTLECGLGKNPLPERMLPELYLKLRETLAVAAVL